MTARAYRPVADLVREVQRGALAIEEALAALDPRVASEVSLSLEVDPASPLAVRGVPAGPGAASGHAAFHADEVLTLASAGVPALLVVFETFPEDIAAMKASRGVVTVNGGLTGHAGVVSRGLGKPCIASGSALDLRGDSVEVWSSPRRVWRAGDRFSFDGRTGAIVAGAALVSRLDAAIEEALAWADRVSGARFTASVSSVEDAQNARRFGASAIALDAPDALLLGAERASLVEGARWSRSPDVVASIAGELRAMGEAFGAPLSAIGRARLPAHREGAIGACLDEAARSLDLSVTERADAIPPTRLAEARLRAALDVLGPTKV